jgi:hypothetical protein
LVAAVKDLAGVTFNDLRTEKVQPKRCHVNLGGNGTGRRSSLVTRRKGAM